MGYPLLLQTKVTIVGKPEMYNWENVIGPFLVHKFWGPRSPPPPLRILPWGWRGRNVFSNNFDVPVLRGRRYEGLCSHSGASPPLRTPDTGGVMQPSSRGHVGTGRRRSFGYATALRTFV